MQYFIAFLEGIITFISPCLLPMLPVYISYFAGGDSVKTVRNAGGFIVGFTVVFVLMGALAGALGGFFVRYKNILDFITGAVVIFFGLNFLGVFKLNVFKGMKPRKKTDSGFMSAFIFGVVFSVGWTPCVGTFLGSALMLAASSGHTTEGVIMLLCYSIGLGIPFFISAVLIDRLKTAFNAIKRHYGIINTASGIILIVVGIMMSTGIFSKIMTYLA